MSSVERADDRRFPCSGGCITALFLLLACVGCLPEHPLPAPPAAKKQVWLVVTDDFQRTVELKNRPARVVTLAADLTETVHALGCGSRLVGVDTASDYPQAARKKTKVGNFTTPDLEKLASLRPDLVLLSSATATPDMVGQFASKLTVPVIAFDSRRWDDVLRNIVQVGRCLGVESAAKKLAGRMKRAESRVSTRVAGSKPVRVFLEIWHDPLQTAGGGNFIDDVITLAGGTNVAGQVNKPFPLFSLEALVAADPEVYLVPSGAGHLATESLEKRPGFGRLSAIKNHRAYCVHADWLLRPGPRLALALEELAIKLHPEARQ